METTTFWTNPITILSWIGILYWLIYKLLEWIDTEKFRKINLRYIHFPSQFIAIMRRVHYHEIELDGLKKYGPTFGFNLVNSKTIMVAEPELLQIVFNKEFTNFTNRRVCLCFEF